MAEFTLKMSPLTIVHPLGLPIIMSPLLSSIPPLADKKSLRTLRLLIGILLLLQGHH